jgi:hypothetical protein
MKYIKTYERNNINYLVGRLVSGTNDNFKDEYIGMVHLLKVLSATEHQYKVLAIKPDQSNTFMLYELTKKKYRTSYNFNYEILYSSEDYESAFKKYEFYLSTKKYNL